MTAPRVAVVDPSAFTPAYDHALCAALARAGAEVDLVTSRFAYGDVPEPDGYAIQRLFYRRARGAAGSRARRLGKLATHLNDMGALRRLANAHADVVHFQWVTLPALDARLLPDRPLVLTAHDLLPREPRPGQVRGQRRLLHRMDAVVVHSAYGRTQLVERLGVPADKVHVIHHGAFEHVAATAAAAAPLPPELADASAGADEPVVLFFGLLRPYKGLDTLLAAWQHVTGARLWIVGRPMIDVAPLHAAATDSVRFVERYVTEAEVQACFARADVVVLPYARTERFDQSGVLATALAFGLPTVLSDIGGFGEVAATGAGLLVPPEDPSALRAALQRLIDDRAERTRRAAAARAAAAGPYSWDAAAAQTVALYDSLRLRR